MSVILDALRKSQREHEERGPVLMLVPRSEPDLAPERRLWPWVTAGALALSAMVFAAGYWSLGLPLPWPEATLLAEAPKTVPPAPETVPPEPIARDPTPIGGELDFTAIPCIRWR